MDALFPIGPASEPSAHDEEDALILASTAENDADTSRQRDSRPTSVPYNESGPQRRESTQIEEATPADGGGQPLSSIDGKQRQSLDTETCAEVEISVAPSSLFEFTSSCDASSAASSVKDDGVCVHVVTQTEPSQSETRQADDACPSGSLATSPRLRPLPLKMSKSAYFHRKPEDGSHCSIRHRFLRAIERVGTLEEELNNELRSKKSLWTTIVIKWKRWKNFFQLSLFLTRIQAVEGKHGSNAGLTLYFLRWIIFLNLSLSLLWVVTAVVPFIIYPPDTFSWSIFSRDALRLVEGTEVVGRTWLLYGGYQYEKGAVYGALYEPGTAFPITASLMLLGSLVSLLIVIGRRISGEVVFASWDFHIRDQDAVENLRNAIRLQIREMLHDIEWNQKTITLKQHLLTGIKKLIGTFIFWPVIVSVTAVATFFAIERGEEINEYFGFSFAQSTTITLISLAGQILVRSTVKYEGWHPRVAQQVEGLKLFSVKLINLTVILYTLYEIQQRATDATVLMSTKGSSSLETCQSMMQRNTCAVGTTCCDEQCVDRFDHDSLDRCVPICEENEMGLIFYQLVVTNGFILLLQEVFYALAVKKCFGTDTSLDSAKFFVNIIDTQALVWLGSIVAPLLPVFAVASNVMNFVVKSWLALHIYKPPLTTCSASRNSNMQYSLTLLTLLYSAFPLTSFIYQERDNCGPNQGESMSAAVSNRIRRSPSLIKTLIQWSTNPIVLGGAFFVVTFFCLFERVLKRKWRRMATKSKLEFDRYRRDMQLKMVETRSRSAASLMKNEQRVTVDERMNDKLSFQTYTPMQGK